MDTPTEHAPPPPTREQLSVTLFIVSVTATKSQSLKRDNDFLTYLSLGVGLFSPVQNELPIFSKVTVKDTNSVVRLLTLKS